MPNMAKELKIGKGDSLTFDLRKIRLTNEVVLTKWKTIAVASEYSATSKCFTFGKCP